MLRDFAQHDFEYLADVCVFRVLPPAWGDLRALIADVVGADEARDAVAAHWGRIAIGEATVEIAVTDGIDPQSMRPYFAELVADLAAFGVVLVADCDLIDVAAARPALETLDKALTICRIFEETLIGCVIGCGCAELGWDSAEAIETLTLRRWVEWYRDGLDAKITPRAMLRWMDHAYARTEDADLLRVRRLTERNHASSDAFRAHLGPKRDRLRAALARGSHDREVPASPAAPHP